MPPVPSPLSSTASSALATTPPANGRIPIFVIATDSVLQTKIDAAIKGAEIVRSEWTSDDGCIVTLRLDKKRLQDMMGVKFK